MRHPQLFSKSLLLFPLLCAGACAGNQPQAQIAPPPATPPPVASSQKDSERKVELIADKRDMPSDLNLDTAPVYFEFDSVNIQPEGQKHLQKVAEVLRQERDVILTIEGHADERGTTEYNLALGDRRAKVVRDYLKDLGVDVQRLHTVSYGEAKPAVEGSGEDAWSKNRRDELVPKPKSGA